MEAAFPFSSGLTKSIEGGPPLESYATFQECGGGRRVASAISIGRRIASEREVIVLLSGPASIVERMTRGSSCHQHRIASWWAV